MRSIILIITLTCAMAGAACTDVGPGGGAKGDKIKRPHSPYYDTKSLILQAEKNANGLGLLKRTRTDDEKSETVETKPDWPKDLAILHVIDMAKPGWIGLFKKDSNISAQGKTLHYEAISTKPEVKRINIRFAVTGQPKDMDAIVGQKNYLFESESFAYVSFAYPYGADKPIIDSISIDGRQKIIFSSPFHYHLDGHTLR